LYFAILFIQAQTMTTEGRESEAPPPYAAAPYCIDLSDVESAAERITGLASRTPVLTSTSLDLLCSRSPGSADDPAAADESSSKPQHRSVFFKVEALQRTGSFKFRGALNATLALRERVRKQTEAAVADGASSCDCEDINVVTHSSGNHAQAVALAARIASSIDNQGSSGPRVNATICMPRNCPTVKRNAVAGFGGEIIMVDNTNEAREEMADRIVEERNAHFIHPSEDPKVIAGQGTASLEMVEQVRGVLRQRASTEAAAPPFHSFDKPLDVVIIPVGGGGLASGNTIALRGLFGDNIKIVLAEPKELDDAKRSREAGKLLGHHEDNKLNSVADGLKTTLGPNTWPIVRDLVDDIITVSEEDILRATKLIWERLKVCIEPSAGVGVAVAMSEEFAEKYRVELGIVNVGVILCGGNVDIIETCKLMDQMGL
jgi:serine racemase